MDKRQDGRRGNRRKPILGDDDAAVWACVESFRAYLRRTNRSAAPSACKLLQKRMGQVFTTMRQHIDLRHASDPADTLSYGAIANACSRVEKRRRSDNGYRFWTDGLLSELEATVREYGGWEGGASVGPFLGQADGDIGKKVSMIAICRRRGHMLEGELLGPVIPPSLEKNSGGFPLP